MNRDEAYVALVQLCQEGWLLGVEVFGADDCCQHGPHTECEANGYGLSDRQGALSDCNRAEPFIMRPRDGLMTPSVADLLANEDLGWTMHTDQPALPARAPEGDT